MTEGDEKSSSPLSSMTSSMLTTLSHREGVVGEKGTESLKGLGSWRSHAQAFMPSILKAAIERMANVEAQNAKINKVKTLNTDTISLYHHYIVIKLSLQCH